MKVRCCLCSMELKEKGALIFSPPEDDEIKTSVLKFHICLDCWDTMIKPIVDP